MPHIHTQPNQHDMTVSAYIIRREAGGWKCLVHMHRKIDMLMQIGGHMELDQTPWQALADELRNEAGYILSELKVLQYYGEVPSVGGAIVHPVPVLVNTHSVGNEHYHSDLCYAFVAAALPVHQHAEGESNDLRWLTPTELQEEVAHGVALGDVADIYSFILQQVDTLHAVPADSYSLEKPQSGITYKR